MDAGVLGDDVRDPRSDEQEGLAIVAGAHEWDRFALKSADLAVGQDGLEPVANLDAGAVIVDGIQNQNAAVGGLAAYSPLMEEVDGVAFDIGAIERVNGDDGDLGVRLLVDFAADVVHLRDGVLVQNVSEIVDVIGGFELSDGFGLRWRDE